MFLTDEEDIIAVSASLGNCIGTWGIKNHPFGTYLARRSWLTANHSKNGSFAGNIAGPVCRLGARL
jgi:hypothetical protein